MPHREPRDPRAPNGTSYGPAKTSLIPNKAISEAHAFLMADGHGKSIQTYQKGQTLFAQGQNADQVFYIESGRVKVSTASDRGKDAIVGILEKGQFVGESCLAGQLIRQTTATAIEVSRLTLINRSAMRDALQEASDFAQSFVNYLLARNRRIEDDLVNLLLNSSEKRLARLLLILANHGKGRDGPVTAVTLSQETLAEMIGTTRSRVSFFMNKFRSAGHISYAGPSAPVEVHHSLSNLVLENALDSR